VRVADATCPFCGGAHADVSAAPARPARRLGRAAAIVASSLTIVGCSSTSSTPVYGAPAPTDSGSSDAASEAGDDAAMDTGGLVAAYGGPALDSGAADDASSASDTGGAGPVYGAPPP
jgi:hypothetical protein